MNNNTPTHAVPTELPAASGSSQPIRSLQYMLNQLAIHNDVLTRLAVDGIFGERTLEAVMVFQRENKLPVTGVVDLTTWNAIRDAYVHVELMYGFPPALNVLPCGTYTAVEGQECEVLRIVQAMFGSLNKVMSNFKPCQINCCNDGETYQNIQEVQRLSGLPVTGILNRSTWAYLVQLYQALVTRA